MFYLKNSFYLTKMFLKWAHRLWIESDLRLFRCSFFSTGNVLLLLGALVLNICWLTWLYFSWRAWISSRTLRSSSCCLKQRLFKFFSVSLVFFCFLKKIFLRNFIFSKMQFFMISRKSVGIIYREKQVRNVEESTSAGVIFW